MAYRRDIKVRKSYFESIIISFELQKVTGELQQVTGELPKLEKSLNTLGVQGLFKILKSFATNCVSASSSPIEARGGGTL